MIIAVNISFLLPEQADDHSLYLQQLCAGMAVQHPEHSFVFIVGEDFKVSITGSNVRVVRSGPGSSNTLQWKWWMAFTLPGLLKKNGAELLVSAAGYGCLKTRIPQVLVLPGLDFAYAHSCYTKKQAAFFVKNISRCPGQIRRVIVFSDAVKKDIQHRYKFGEETITVVPAAAGAHFRPLGYAERQEVKEKYTRGADYLLYSGAIHTGKNLLHLLKAFSVFKKKQKTGIKLVFTSSPAASYTSFAKDLKTYRYRDDVLSTGPLTDGEKARVTASAYALLSPAFFEGMAIPVLEALQSGVPVICSPGSAAEDIAGDAGLYASPEDYTAIAAKMILLYKDEKERAARVQQGFIRVADYTAEQAGAKFWQVILS